MGELKILRKSYILWINILVTLILLLTSFISICSIAETYPTFGITYYVGGTGTGNYTTIQSAINDASNGDTVFVYNGTYNENVIVDKSISLIGEAVYTTIIDGGGLDNCIFVSVDNVTIRSLSITNSKGQLLRAGIKFDTSSNSRISHCYIYNHNHTAILLRHSSNNNLIENCVINNSWNKGIFLEAESNKVKNCTIKNCGDIGLVTSSHCIVTNCTLFNNRIGIGASGANNYLIYHNNFLFNTEYSASGSSSSTKLWNKSYPSGGNFWTDYNGIDEYSGSDQNISGSDGIGDTPYTMLGGGQDHYPLMSPWNLSIPPFIDFTYTPLYPETGQSVEFNASSCFDVDGNITSYQWDWDNDGVYDDTGVEVSHAWMSAGNYPVTLNVTDDDNLSSTITKKIPVGIYIINVDDDYNASIPGWNVTHFNSIQEGINHGIVNGIVYVHNGTYYENIIVDKKISVIGENKNITIIHGGYNDDNVIMITEEYAFVSDFKIRQHGYVPEDVGIRVMASYTTIRNCIITSNYYGIHVFNDWSNYAIGCFIEQCDINNNVCGVFLQACDCDISSCNIQSNFDHGFYFDIGGYGDISTCKIDSNFIGIYYANSHNNHVVNNEFVGNDLGIIFEYYSSDIIVYHNNFFSDGGIYLNLSNDNYIHHNNFYDTGAYDDEMNNWDNGYPQGGNYWDDYTGSDADGDFIGDSPYSIDGGSNDDNYPLMLPEWYLTDLNEGWNLISIPMNLTIDKDQLRVCSGFDDYRWPDAVSNGWISDFFFGWDRQMQSYEFCDTLESGQGYWIYSNDDYELWVITDSFTEDNFITSVDENWNIIGIPFSDSLSKTDITISYNGSDYSWSDAVNAGIISNYLFGWNQEIQSYDFYDTFEPGQAYWLYAYKQCTLKRS